MSAGGAYIGKQLDKDQNDFVYDTEGGVVEIALISKWNFYFYLADRLEEILLKFQMLRYKLTEIQGFKNDP